MISPGNLLRVAVIRWLETYCRRDKSIRHCFIRHSTATAAQNPVLSDFDLAFFVEASNFDSLQIPARRLRDTFKKTRILNCIVLPATDAAYRMCAAYYPLRSTYPMANWLRVYGDPLPVPAVPVAALPFDHTPEAFLSTYIVPVMRRQKNRHVFENALMRRKLGRDRLRIQGSAQHKPPKRFHDIVAAEVNLWDEFYSRIPFTAAGDTISVIPQSPFHTRSFEEQSIGMAGRLTQIGLESLWLYPGFFDDRSPNLVLNLKSPATAEACELTVAAVLAMFDGLDLRLHIGTERSMCARIGGLSRVSLIDPWLFKTLGICLVGDPSVRDRVPEPTIDEVRAKLSEYLLYLSYRVFCLRPYPYVLYSLAFTLHRLFQKHELTLHPDSLAEIYGKALLPQSQLQGPEGRRRFLSAWKELHNFDLFNAHPRG